MRRNIPLWLEAALMAILPCLPLFNIYHEFGSSDWADHQFRIGYIGAYLRDHVSFPDIVSSARSIGSACGIFYGTGLYGSLGLLSTVLHPHVSILIAAYLLHGVEYGALVLLLLRMGLPRWFARMAAITVLFETYPLTNLYNRGDVPESFAATALTIAVAALLLSVLSNRPGHDRWYGVSLIAFAFMATSHRITLLNAGMFMALYGPLLVWLGTGQSRRLCVAMAGIPVILLLLLAPWLYAYISVDGQLYVNLKTHGAIALFPDTIDSLAARLSPLLLPVATNPPYLEAPANTCLLAMACLVIVSAIRQYGPQRRLVVLTLLMTLLFACYVWSSVSYTPWNYFLPSGLRLIQFTYRLATMMNLAALGLLLGAGLWLQSNRLTVDFTRPAKIMALLLCAVSSIAFMQKVTHAYAAAHPGGAFFLPDGYARSLLDTSPSQGDFSTPTFFAEAPTDSFNGIRFTSIAHPYGDVPPVPIHSYTGGWYDMNVTAFIWNSILVDGKPAALYRHNVWLSIYLTPGDHVIAYAFTPPPAWVFLSHLAFVTCILLILYTLSPASFLAAGNWFYRRFLPAHSYNETTT